MYVASAYVWENVQADVEGGLCWSVSTDTRGALERRPVQLLRRRSKE